MAEKWISISSIGQIATRLNEPIHRIEYAVKSRAIVPCALAGNARVFDEAAVERIAAALRDIDGQRDRGARCIL